MDDSAGTGVVDLSAERVRAVPRRGTATATVAGLLLAAGALLIPLLLVQFFDAYFAIWIPPPVEDSDVRRYELTASACLIALATSCVLAAAVRRRTLAWAAGILLIIAIAVSLVFAVPQNRWAPEVDAPAPLPTNDEPCYSGSGDCSGGG